VEISWIENGSAKQIYFSGDLGNTPTPFLRQTEYALGAEYLVIESTYGDRVHEEREERKKYLVSAIVDTIKKGGVLMIPSFAMERTQEILFELNDILNKKLIPEVPFFIDSPLAVDLTKIYKQHSEYFNEEANNLLKSGDDIFNFPGLKFTKTVEESKLINDVPPPKIIIAGSGMSQGGRIIHHEKRYLSDENSTILFVGYQVDGSLGRKIQRGDKMVTLFGEQIPIRCRVMTISSYSAHADQPTLLKWIETANSEKSLGKVFVVQGEEAASKTLANLVREKFSIDAILPVMNQSFDL
jgi:metallo-beta-lactamase family protein